MTMRCLILATAALLPSCGATSTWSLEAEVELPRISLSGSVPPREFGVTVTLTDEVFSTEQEVSGNVWLQSPLQVDANGWAGGTFRAALIAPDTGVILMEQAPRAGSSGLTRLSLLWIWADYTDRPSVFRMVCGADGLCRREFLLTIEAIGDLAFTVEPTLSAWVEGDLELPPPEGSAIHLRVTSLDGGSETLIGEDRDPEEDQGRAGSPATGLAAACALVTLLASRRLAARPW